VSDKLLPRLEKSKRSTFSPRNATLGSSIRPFRKEREKDGNTRQVAVQAVTAVVAQHPQSYPPRLIFAMALLARQTISSQLPDPRFFLRRESFSGEQWTGLNVSADRPYLVQYSAEIWPRVGIHCNPPKSFACAVLM